MCARVCHPKAQRQINLRRRLKTETKPGVRFPILALFFALLTPLAFAATPAAKPQPDTPIITPPPDAKTASAAATEMSSVEAIILGIVEGVTEFLPGTQAPLVEFERSTEVVAADSVHQVCDGRVGFG